MIRILIALIVLSVASIAADAPDPEAWSRFRGPNGSGVSTSTHLPTEFGTDKNVIWKTELPFGHSSPALTRDRIFLTAARSDQRGPGENGERDGPTSHEKIVHVWLLKFSGFLRLAGVAGQPIKSSKNAERRVPMRTDPS